MPRRRRFKPRKDCAAILGKLAHYWSQPPIIFTILPKPPFKCAALLFVATARQSTRVCSALALIATLKSEGLVVVLWPTLPSAGDLIGFYLRRFLLHLTWMTIWLYVKYYPSRHSSLRHRITSAQIEKLRDRRAYPCWWPVIALGYTFRCRVLYLFIYRLLEAY